MRWPGASLVLLAAACPAAAPCATYITKKDWNVVDPIESDRCTGRFMLASAEFACTAAAVCLAICADNGMPCKCDGSGPCEPGGGSLPKFETRKGLQQEYLGVEVYLKQPTACPWGEPHSCSSSSWGRGFMSAVARSSVGAGADTQCRVFPRCSRDIRTAQCGLA